MLTEESLETATLAVFQNSARSIYDVYHYIQDPETAGRLFSIEPSFKALLDRPEFDARGLVIAGLHLSNFDLALQWICSMRWIKPLILTIPNPQNGRQLEFEIRQRTGMNLVPASMTGMRQAFHHLKQGGVVATGIDRPAEEPQHHPRFFGRPACLPNHPSPLALKTHAPVILVACRLEKDAKYHLYASPPIEMDPNPDHTQELLCNTEKVLVAAEHFIRQSPQEWSVSLPVWPEVLDLVPN
jgi:KDO2-lipid IV(A) lauroyltransferase